MKDINTIRTIDDDTAPAALEGDVRFRADRSTNGTTDVVVVETIPLLLILSVRFRTDNNDDDDDDDIVIDTASLMLSLLPTTVVVVVVGSDPNRDTAMIVFFIVS
jgi:IS4 transposase